MSNQKSYEGFGIVELFGHQRIAGRISEQSIGGCSFVRVDVPAVNGVQSFSKFYGNGAIYAITPTDEETANSAAAAIQARPVQIWMSSSLPRYESLPEPDDDNYRRHGRDDIDDDDDMPY